MQKDNLKDETANSTNTVLVAVAMKYAVWKDETYGYAYGTIEQSKGKEIVEYCKDYDDARITWKWYYYKP